MTRRVSRSSRSSLCCCAKVRQKSDLPQKMCHRCVITPQCSRRKIACCRAVGCKLTNFPIKTLQKRHDKEFKKKSEPSKCWFPCAFVPECCVLEANTARSLRPCCAHGCADKKYFEGSVPTSLIKSGWLHKTAGEKTGGKTTARWFTLGDKMLACVEVAVTHIRERGFGFERSSGARLAQRPTQVPASATPCIAIDRLAAHVVLHHVF